jgi:hypothetical protein
MLVTLTHADGSEQTMDVSGLRLSVNGCPLEISPGRVPSSVVLNSPGDDETWHQLVVSPGAANVIHLEVLPRGRPTGSPVAG